MLNFPNSSLILLVAHSIHKIFVKKKMTQKYVTKTLDAKNTMFVLQGLRSGCNYNKHQHSRFRHMKRKPNTQKKHPCIKGELCT
jgi:hypothetical protein